MASGKKKEKAAKESTQKAVKALAPSAYEDPFGKFKKGKFTPYENEHQIASRNTIDESLNNLVGQVPTEFDVESYYNNPFYDLTSRMYRRVLDRQREQDTKDLDDILNARNQLGSSYDALRRRDFDQMYADRYDQADDQARMASANAYQQAYQNILESLRGLSNERSAALERTYAPAKMALSYQQAVAPLQNAQAAAWSNFANIQANRTTGFDRFLQTGNMLGNLMAGGGKGAEGFAQVLPFLMAA